MQPCRGEAARTCDLRLHRGATSLGEGWPQRPEELLVLPECGVVGREWIPARVKALLPISRGSICADGAGQGPAASMTSEPSLATELTRVDTW